MQKQIITKSHPDFNELLDLLCDELKISNECKHNFENLFRSFNMLENKKGYEISRVNTIRHLKSEGGYCDCEIMMNVQVS